MLSKTPVILIADDTPELREILALRVQSLGNDVVTASNGAEAMEILSAQPVDLVLLDIMMPELNGYQVLERMKSSLDLRKIPVIVISAVSELDSVVRCIQLGAEDYLPKPFNAVLLKARLQASLERKRLNDLEQELLQAVEREQQRSEQLLHSIFPDLIAVRLKAGERVIADNYENVSVLFADVVGFTGMTAKMSAQQLVETLNRVFSFFEDIARRYKVEKIKTIGDGVMLVCGLPSPRPDHAQVIARAALAIQMEAAAALGPDLHLEFRIGIHSGPVVAGVIGTSKFSFDLWGDTVNVASRMEALGERGAIQVSETTYELLKDDFQLVERGVLFIKGRGDMRSYFLIGEK